MLWDQAMVRNIYKLRPDPESFVSYQRFGWKLLHHVTRNKTVKVLQQFERDHARTVGYFEPITMILDHLAFSPELSARAVAALGGSSRAFLDVHHCGAIIQETGERSPLSLLNIELGAHVE